MSRQIYRVPLDFNHPLEETWPGFLDSGMAKCAKCRARPKAGSNFVRREDCQECFGYGLVDVDPPSGEGWQVWEKVSEGSPVTPVFPTAEALAKYLSTVGDLWHQKTDWLRREPLPTYQQALDFVLEGGCGGLTIDVSPSSVTVTKEYGQTRNFQR